MEGFPNNLEPIRQFMLEAISQKCEGLMLKLLDSAEITTEIVKAEDDEEDPQEGSEESEEDQLEGEADADTEIKTEEGVIIKKTRRKALLATYEPGR
jgi:DNA ligase-1